MRNAIYNYNARGHDLIGLMDELQQQARQKLASGKYQEAAVLYEQGIEISPEIVSNYWHLGLAQLLQGREEEAQITWMMPMLAASDEQVEELTAELLTVLNSEANNQAANSAWDRAWLLRQHFKEINPHNFNNLLHLLLLSIKTEKLTEDELFLEAIASCEAGAEAEAIDESLLKELLQEAFQLNPLPFAVLRLAEVSAARLPKPEVVMEILLAEGRKFSGWHQYQLGTDLARLCLRLAPNNLDALFLLMICCRELGPEGNWESFQVAEQYFEQSQDLSGKVAATHQMLCALMKVGGEFERGKEVYGRYKSLLLSFVAGDQEMDLGFIPRLMTMGSFCFYFEDTPSQNRLLRNQIGNICQTSLQSDLKEQVKQYQQSQKSRGKISLSASKTLKIGYLSNFLRQHSVGWLVRWLLKYHNDSEFEVHLYSSWPSSDSLQQDLIQQYQERFHQLNPSAVEIANQINADEIDLLVDLDSLTALNTCEVMALKPAPVQVTWLGFDATGLPGVDYFMADPYVLPDQAQEYYQEKIWRLPHTYIAVDGFENSVPTLRREHLDIPQEAIIYFSSQSGYKRHPDNVRLQMKILSSVPNSYFLVKGLRTEKESMAGFFNRLAEEEGVSSERLRFLPAVDNEAIHRANLTIADVVLDTYPYNGATTTLETLWMGIPIVTRVGEQFAARNSYSMMMNAGIREGIAWTEEEYIEWGVRLGKDEELRQTIQWKLRQSRHGSPLWNGEKFARQMENAYQQMWMRYITVDSG